MNDVLEVTIQDGDSEWSPSEEKEKRTTKKSSEIWNYFTLLNSQYARCKICDNKFSYRTTISNLKKHVINRHGKTNNIVLSNSKSGRSSKSIMVPVEEHEKSDDHGEGGSTHEDIPHGSESSPKKSKIYKSYYPSKDSIMPPLSPMMRFYGALNNSHEVESDEFDAFGQIVAAKLRKMDERQRLFCERIINDAVFKGTFSQLTPLTEIVICISAPQSS